MNPEKNSPFRTDFLCGAAVAAMAVAGGSILAGRASMPIAAEAAEKKHKHQGRRDH
jgi:hypothetical protein